MPGTNPRPKFDTIRQAVGILRKLVREQPDDPSTPYRRGMLEGLAWVAGDNPRLHRLMGASIANYLDAHGLRAGGLAAGGSSSE